MSSVGPWADRRGLGCGSARLSLSLPGPAVRALVAKGVVTGGKSGLRASSGKEFAGVFLVGVDSGDGSLGERRSPPAYGRGLLYSRLPPAATQTAGRQCCDRPPRPACGGTAIRIARGRRGHSLEAASAAAWSVAEFEQPWLRADTGGILDAAVRRGVPTLSLEVRFPAESAARTGRRGLHRRPTRLGDRGGSCCGA